MLTPLLLFLASSLPPGQIHAAVGAEADPKQTYALYLPSYYDPAKAWPILYGLDAGARGKLVVETYRDAAEKHGWIVAASNVSRNGPWTVIREATEAMVADTRAHLNVDPKRVYFTGFSGGARASFDYASRHPGTVAGIVAAGMGLPDDRDAWSTKVPVFFVAGDEDFNYRPARDAAEALVSAGGISRFRVFAGVHAWFPPIVAMQAIEWHEALAMRSGVAPKDPKKIETLWATALGRAKEAEKLDDVREAQAAYAAAAQAFFGLRDTAEATAAARRLERSQAFRTRRTFEREIDRREDRFVAELRRQFGAKAPWSADREVRAKRIAAIGVPELLRTWREKRGTPEAESAARLLTVAQSSARAQGTQALLDGDAKRAIVILELAVAIAPQDALAQYNLACAWASLGKVDEGIRALRASAEAGFADAAMAETDADLAPLRGTPEFAGLLDRMRANR
ncbi:MAG TPA: dienelactone hydrolase family protein [Candidatus Polarisedimenticolaceae bacterium]